MIETSHIVNVIINYEWIIINYEWIVDPRLEVQKPLNCTRHYAVQGLVRKGVVWNFPPLFWKASLAIYIYMYVHG